MIARSLDRGTAEDALTYFLEMLGLCLQKHSPYRKTVQQKKSHPWLNENCEEAISKKNAAEGKPNFAAVQASCAEVLAKDYHLYLTMLKEKIASSKRWSKCDGN